MTILYKRSHFTKPARVSLTSPPGRNNKWVAIINSLRAGGPGHKPLYGCLLRKMRHSMYSTRNSMYLACATEEKNREDVAFGSKHRQHLSVRLREKYCPRD